jgi:hypothetical protein
MNFHSALIMDFYVLLFPGIDFACRSFFFFFFF